MKKLSVVHIIAIVVISIAILFLALWVLLSGLIMPKAKSGNPDIYGFAELPVLLDGRTQPIDSTARNAMRVIRHKSTARRKVDGKDETYPAVEWLLELAAKPDIARARPVFRIDNEEVKDNLGLAKDEKHFSVNQITAGDNFQRLAKWKETNGSIHIPDNTEDPELVALNKWVSDQRVHYKRQIAEEGTCSDDPKDGDEKTSGSDAATTKKKSKRKLPKLSHDKIAKLQSIGFEL